METRDPDREKRPSDMPNQMDAEAHGIGDTGATRSTTGGGTTSGSMGTMEGGVMGQGQQAGGTTSEAREMASEMAHDAREMAGEITHEARKTFTSMMDNQKSRAAESVHNIADIMRQTGQQLSEQDQRAMAQYAERAADQIDHLSGYLRDADMRRIRGDLERFSRREPTFFIGGAFTLGLLAARFLKSSSPRQPMTGGYGTEQRREPPGIGRMRAEESLQSQRGQAMGEYETSRNRHPTGREGM